MMVYYRWPVTPGLLWLPVFLGAAILTAAGAGLTLSALNVSFRDVKYAVPFLVQIGLFLTPVIYPARYLSHRAQILMGLNPMAGVVIGFRHALLGSEASWGIMGLSLGISVLLFGFGLLIFRRMENRFADII
jgi:lipopolysaccharide transport system permease protein